MKAISIKQPWASLIANGIKDIENRTWKLPEKYKGQRVLIHASAKSADFWDYPNAGIVHDFIDKITKTGTDYSQYPHGAIIGSVQLVDCVINHPSIWAEKSYKAQSPGHEDLVIYNWILANPILFPEPIPAKGKLSFWDYNGTLPDLK
jgi:predicted transcriptional regulator